MKYMSELGEQQAISPVTKAQKQARYFNSANAFNIKLPRVPAKSFDAVVKQAMQPDAATAWYTCDQSDEIGCSFPATTPLVLARYARINRGGSLSAKFNASGLICYVIKGSGEVIAKDDELVQWQAGDVLLLSGGKNYVFSAIKEDAVLWVVTDEPLYHFNHVDIRQQSSPYFETIHYLNNDIQTQLKTIQEALPDEGTSGRAVIFSSEQLAGSRNLLSTLTLSLNSLPPHEEQAPHRHNSAAITLVVKGDHCYTRIDDEKCPWTPWSTLVTPATAKHEHHNEGNQLAQFLIVQDGGLYYHARTMGFQHLNQSE